MKIFADFQGAFRGKPLEAFFARAQIFDASLNTWRLPCGGLYEHFPTKMSKFIIKRACFFKNSVI